MGSTVKFQRNKKRLFKQKESLWYLPLEVPKVQENSVEDIFHKKDTFEPIMHSDCVLSTFAEEVCNDSIDSKPKIPSDANIIPKEKRIVWVNMSFEDVSALEETHSGDKLYDNIASDECFTQNIPRNKYDENVEKSREKKHHTGEQITSQDLKCVFDSSSNGKTFEKSVKKNQKEFLTDTFECEVVETESSKYISPQKSRKEKEKWKEYQAEAFLSATECEVAENRLKENLNNKKKKYLQGEQIISQDLECVCDSSTNGNISKKSVPEKNWENFSSEREVVEPHNLENPGDLPIKKSHKHKRKRKEYKSNDFLTVSEYEVTQKKLKENLNTKNKKRLQGEQIISQDLECVCDFSTIGNISKKSVPEKNGEKFSSEAEKTSECKVVETDNLENTGDLPIKKSHKHKRKRKEYKSNDFLTASEYEVTEKELKENLNTKNKKHLQGEQIISQDLECVCDFSANGNISKKSVPEKNWENFSSEREVVETHNLENPGDLPIKKSHKHKRKRKEYKSNDFLTASEYEVTEKELKENLNTKNKKHLQGEQIISQDLECVCDFSTNENISKKSVPEKNGEKFSSEAEKTSECKVVETDNLENTGDIPIKKSHKRKRKWKEYQSNDFLIMPEYERTEKEPKENLKTKKKKHLQGEQIISQDLECVCDSSTNRNISKKSVPEKNGEKFSSEAEKTSECKVVETDNLENTGDIPIKKSHKHKRKRKEYQLNDFLIMPEYERTEKEPKENLNTKKKKHLQREQIISQDLECVCDSSTNGNISKNSVPEENGGKFSSEAEKTSECKAVETDNLENTGDIPIKKSHKHKRKRKEYQSKDFLTAPEYEVTGEELKENLNTKRKKRLQAEQIISQDLERVCNSSIVENNPKKSVPEKNGEEFSSECEVVETDNLENPGDIPIKKSHKHKRKRKKYQSKDFLTAPEYEVTVKELKENLNTKNKKHLQGEQIISQDLECVCDFSTNGNISKKSVPKKNGEEVSSECEVVKTDNLENPGDVPIKKSHKHKHKRKRKEYKSNDFLTASEYEVTEKELKENLNTKNKNYLQGEQIIPQDLERACDSSTNENISKTSVPEKNGEKFSSEAEKTSECEVVETDNLDKPGYISMKKSHKRKHKRKWREYQSKDSLTAPEYEVTGEELKENFNTKKKKYLLGEQIISQDLECVCDSSANGNISKKSVPKENRKEIFSKAEKASLWEVETDNLQNSRNISTMEYQSAENSIYDSEQEITDYVLLSPWITAMDLEPAPVNFLVPLLHENESLAKLTADMKESLREKGVMIKYGKFSEEEDAILLRNYQQFVKKFGVDDPCLLFGIGLKRKNPKVLGFLKAKHFYVRLGKGLENRPLLNIYKRARTVLNPFRSSERFEKEEIAKLKNSHNLLGNKWTDIGNILGRTDTKCKVSYRWHAKKVNKGKWSSEEENNLINAIKTVAETNDISSNNIGSISWDAVDRLVPTRNAFQCRHYWGEHLAWDPNVTEKMPWDQSSYAKLIYLLKYKYCASTEREINWKELQKNFINVSPSYIFLTKKLAYLKQYTAKKKRHSNFQYSEMLDFLYKTYEKYIDVASYEAETSNVVIQLLK
ncbi:transcription termination factor 1 [Trichonephila clavata]|uniref:Transcription termination factor 1 n=1 Tax=Trichonephila clavata TaxID=2740835 RepID=A0A8X6M206_TRICU|nr:transcription termination factor 1 [Trichonephila clavata]